MLSKTHKIFLKKVGFEIHPARPIEVAGKTVKRQMIKRGEDRFIIYSNTHIVFSNNILSFQNEAFTVTFSIFQDGTIDLILM